MSYRRTKAVSFDELDRIERDVQSAVTALGVLVVMLRSSGFALSLVAGKIPMMVYYRDATEANCGKHFSKSSGCCRIVAPAGPSMA
ncbi:MAG: hypothetical protein KGM92_01555 [Acidobacteriota bacterium]|nr:hypothetical protein [Acidobacteriota bacterium]